MDNIIVSRDFDVYNVEQVKIGTVQVLINKPEVDANVDGDWNCTYQVLGRNDDKIRNSYGVDSLQALLLCIKKIVAELQHYQRTKNVALRWLESDILGLETEMFT